MPQKWSLGLALLAGSLVLSLGAQSIRSQPSAARVNFSGRYLAALSDADFLASTYADGRLPEPNPQVSDRLSLIRLPLDGSQRATAQVRASNSVTAAPFSLAVAADGRTAFVVEALGPMPAGATRRDQLPPGRQLVAVDLSNPQSPTVRDRIAIGPQPETVDVHPNGNWLVVTTQTEGREITLVPVQDGKFGQPQTFSLRQLGIEPDARYFQNGRAASYAAWHPSGRYLAVTLNYRDEVIFLELQGDEAGGKLQLRRWGEAVKVGKDPFSGQFTPDGRFFITTNWGRNFGAQITTLAQRLPTEPGTLSVIRVAELGASAAQARHRVVATATSDLNPEGIAISPDGSLVVTVNMRGSAFPENSARFTRQSSLSLLKLDRDSGQLTKVGDYPFEGILPENATFDASGNSLAVAVYDYFTPQPEGGVEIWRVVRQPSLALERTGVIIDVGRGVHQVVLVR